MNWMNWEQTQIRQTPIVRPEIHIWPHMFCVNVSNIQFEIYPILTFYTYQIWIPCSHGKSFYCRWENVNGKEYLSDEKIYGNQFKLR